MKIYCSNSLNDIQDFIGTDLWVKMYNSDFDRNEYVNMTCIRQADWDNTITMLDFYAIDTSIFEMLYENRVTNTQLNRLHGYYNHRYHEKELSRGLFWFLDRYTLIEPIDVLTDEEIHSCFEEVCKLYM